MPVACVGGRLCVCIEAHVAYAQDSSIFSKLLGQSQNIILVAVSKLDSICPIVGSDECQRLVLWLYSCAPPPGIILLAYSALNPLVSLT